MTTLDRATTEQALEAADLRVLLMSLHHITGDPRWITDYRPSRDVNLIADEGAGFDDAVQARIRAEALEALTGDVSPAFEDPGEDRMIEMMRACLGEQVGAEYQLMMREELGFVDRGIGWRAPSGSRRPVVVVGAGPSGIVLGVRLAEMGLDHVILEERGEVGGAWTANRYPGCAVDTPNHAYSFSFGRRQDWSRYFSSQPELHRYMVERSHEFGVRDRIRFNTRLTGARWDDEAACWRCAVEGPDGPEEIEALALVSAIGPLSLPKIQRFEGDEAFEGRRFHSAEWPEDVDLTGKRVAVIGTGASSMQICTAIADTVGALTIYQRTAQWAPHIPRFKDEMSAETRWLLQNVPYYAEWFRFTMLWRYGDGLLKTLRRDPNWKKPERSMNRTNERHRLGMEAHIRSELEGRPDLIEKAMPDYPPYGKRILLDHGWFKMLRRDNVDLVTDRIERFQKDGIVAGALREHDIVVIATGFEVGLSAARLNLIGRGGIDLCDQWANEEITAHIGITAPNFPNFFITQGPGTGLAHGGSAILTSECQIRYICGCLAALVDGGGVMEVRQAAHDAYMERLDAEHRELIWAHPGVNTYYRNANGRVHTIMPWRLVDFWEMTRAPDLDDFEFRAA